MLKEDGRYQHSNPVCTLGMHVHNIHERSKAHIRMRISLFHLKNGKMQYTGKDSGYFENVELPIEKEADWSEYKPEEYVKKGAR